MISIRNLAVIGLGIALAGCQTDLGESIGTILKRDEPEPPAATGVESPPPAHGPWGPETRARVLGSSADQPQAAAIHEVVKQFQCTAAAVKEVDARVNAGRLAAVPGSAEHRTRRACVVIGLCDTIDGIPDYFHWAQFLSGGKETEFKEECTGVESWGPEMIASEPELFAVARRIRDEHQAAFRTGAR